ncbi:uncharacterized protein A4U43_C10F5050 [Asparagus officinalis]|uniref:RIN4 pathogenic type III effector avirulence factor Avr cleavage site domain-containing protein n=1 Tax=Asparagus officinalis TaxID=4686 RepID=A0A5P1E190_ASPOF|nr:RPM1-interacting protein 4-like isoform X2 [Asparagus officinalis]ONK56189.1 uncharacterized protein A4U43_C10F5050 [Asparagus officinalis]
MENAHMSEDLKAKDDLHQPIDSPQQKNERHNLNDPIRKVSRISGGSDRSIEQSPLHRNHVKSSWERRNSTEAPNTPGRFKTRTGGRGDDSPDKSPAVPRFGDWDENNPSSGEGFTGIFEKVREEKQNGSAKVPHLTDDSVYPYSSYGSNSSGCWCFSWCRK